WRAFRLVRPTLRVSRCRSTRKPKALLPPRLEALVEAPRSRSDNGLALSWTVPPEGLNLSYPLIMTIPYRVFGLSTMSALRNWGPACEGAKDGVLDCAFALCARSGRCLRLCLLEAWAGLLRSSRR